MRRDLVRLLRQSAGLTLALALTQCTDANDPMRPSVQALFTTPTGLVTANPPQIFIGAGDISSCSNTGDEATAKLLDADKVINPTGTVYNLGDDAYNNGTDAEFACYDATWGRHKARTKPSAGNHEYNTSGATGYYKYFGAAAGDPAKGYYSYDLGLWHIIVLNSNIARSTGSAQDVWLAADLAAHPNQCTLAYWHHPLYSSTGGTGSGGISISSMRPYWDRLYAAHADLVLNGHRHFYERLAPMKPDGSSDPVNGIREIIVGSGGIGGGSETNLFPTHETGNGSTFGVLRLYLYDDSYAWKFLPVAGKTYTDSGSTACHASGSGGGGGVSATNSSVTASPSSITAGTGSSTITVTARDGNNATMAGASVSLTASGSGNLFTPSSGTTNSSGVFTSTLTSTKAEDKTVSAKINGVAVTQTQIVTVTPGTEAGLAFTTQPTNTAANAPITPAVVVEVQDAYGNRTASGATVGMDFGANPGSGTLAGTVSQVAVNGVATFADLSINKIATGYTLAASASGLTGSTSNPFNITTPVPSASLSSVTAVTPSFTAGGSSAINIVVKDGLNNPMSGVAVTLSSSVAGDVITQPAVTDGTGATSGTVAATVAGSHTITAVAASVTLNTKPQLTVTAGPADAATSTLTALPATITQGSGSSTITVTVKDQYGNPVNGSNVVLAATGSGNTLTGGGSTNASGVATGSLSSTVAEPKTVSAKAGTLDIAQTASVTVTPPSSGITQSLLTAGSDVTNQKIYTTASITPAANALVTIAVIGHTSTAASASPTITGGGMSAWVEVTTVTFNSVGTPLKRMSIFRAMSAAPTSGPITISFPTTESNAAWIVSQWTGVDTTGSNGSGAIAQIATPVPADGVTSIGATLAPLGSANNVAYGVVGTNGSAIGINPGSGFAEISEQKPAESPNTILESLFAANQTAPSASWTGAFSAAILAIEIKAGP